MEHIGTATPWVAWHVLPRVVSTVCVTMLAALPALLVPEAIEGWYATLVHPTFAPSPGLFGPVWILLYWLMGVAAGLVWSQRHAAVRGALVLYGAQLLVNASWTLVFFGLHAPQVALVVIIVLLALIVLTIRSFIPVHRMAAWLLVPYLLWVLFAAVLNLSYVYLN